MAHSEGRHRIPVALKTLARHRYAPSKVVIAGNDSFFRIGLKQSLADLFPDSLVVDACTYPALISALQPCDVDLVLLDLGLPGLNGYLSILALRQLHGTTRLLAISGIDAPLVSHRLRALGITGFASKRCSRERIGKVISSVAHRRTRALSKLPLQERKLIDGLIRLTPAELNLFAQLPDKPSHLHIMKALGIALPTVKAHMSQILKKLDLRNRTEAAVVANQLSVLTSPSLVLGGADHPRSWRHKPPKLLTGA